MKKQDLKHIIVNGIRRPYVQDEVLLGDWKAVQDIKASEITHRDEDDEILRGLLFKGYEMKWGVTNTNGEQYEQGAFSKFIQEYFVDKKMNMPVTLEHSWEPRDIVGRVLYIEVNTTGFYFVAYVPETCPNYNLVKWLAEQGLIQGFSKEGWVLNGEWKQNPKDKDDWYYLIKEIMTTRVSLVTTPANGVRFESVKVANAVAFEDKTTKKNVTKKSCIDSIINH